MNQYKTWIASAAAAFALLFVAIVYFGVQQTQAAERAGKAQAEQTAALTALVKSLQASPRAGTLGLTNFDLLAIGTTLDVGTNATVGGDLTLTGGATVGGDITVTGVITTNGGYIGVTPVATATARPHWCGVQSVNGSATVIPATLTAAGITTPRAPVASLGQDITIDGNSVTVANASGVVTLKVWQLRAAATTTPQAATTPVTIDYCVDGN